jgi:hypothetical protein
VVGELTPAPLCIYVAEGWISPRTNRLYPMDESEQDLVPASVQEYLKTSRKDDEEN